MMLSRKMLATLGLALLATLMAIPAQAQGQGGGGGGRGRGGFGGGFGGPAAQRIALLSSEVVQKDLELSDEQKTQLATLASEMQTEIQGLFPGRGGAPGAAPAPGGGNPEDFRKQFEEAQAKIAEKVKVAEGKVNEILLPPQVDRLKQLSIQQRGTSALEDAEVAEALALSDDQKAELKKIRDERRASFRGPGGGGPGGGQLGGARPSEEEREKLRAEFQAAQKASEEKTLAVLTPEQAAKFEELQGKKIELPRGGFGGGRRGGRGPGGAPGGAGGNN